jgi:hypothetical protein
VSSEPTIAFSTDPACPLAGLMLRRPATISSTRTVCLGRKSDAVHRAWLA